MVRFSNAVIGIVNVLSAIVALVAIGSGIYFYVHQTAACQQFLQAPLLITGAILFLVSLIGLLGSCVRINSLLYIYLTLVFLFILALIGVTIFAFVVTNEGAGRAVSGRGYKEYRLGDYSHWLQNHLARGKAWDNLRTCMVDTSVCQKLASDHALAEDFNKMNLTPVESGCCKPPTYCEFQFRNATYWMVPATGPAVPDSDCTTWSNNQNELCFDCKSCKAGFLANIKHEWKTLLIINACAVVLVMVIYSTGCCAARNNSKDTYSRYRGYP
ncbi:hypothetical protein MLD38_032814 [Melastoma candidum]|uniref:Uncharacterized protein n=1 Tax=Melastoma candidum TaxID=119954 RepID=A0ACB9M4L6_9MYRT|nr:hypothetical protein MLD38_032814 [Melastoma candidum]